MKGASMFSSAGIAETYFDEIGIDIKVANELLSKRAALYSFFHPETEMICGDITDEQVFKKFDEQVKKNDCKFLIATPPCQGMSTMGKKEYSTDKRNYLIFYVIDMIKDNDFDYILIENVPKFLKLFFPYKGELKKLTDIMHIEFSDKYNIDSFVLNAADYGVPQSRPRGFIKMFKNNLKWADPIPKKRITLEEAIGDLPSLESGQDSGIKWHKAKVHNDREILAMSHTPEGKSAMANDFYYPRKPNGEKIKGFHNTYKRMKWNEPSPARAINNGSMGGHNNVHPGRKNKDGTYSDARALTLRETFIVSSLNPDLDLPDWCSETLIRTVIGEAIPPRFSENILRGINSNGKIKKN
ncbi:modification methylase [Mesoplasma lactucae ATCC 49193]|uniref:DNA (cytosine-5-)-methyltransferase n=1 Tax=Mesoplasma lactucae ATCC 49193 TaxID=81460 RepID=A0A291ISV9_9MOLU|nr:modification methylase [Mesoplasma lactucae ATCC 49193]